MTATDDEDQLDIILDSGDPAPDLDGITVSSKRLNAASAVSQAVAGT